MYSFEMQSAKSSVRKLGAAIYLESFVQLPIAAFLSDFRDRWPKTKCEQGREEAGCSHFRIGLSQIAVEVRRTSVPRSVTNSVLQATLHWPTAEQDLSTHQAHIAVAASNDNGDTVLLASDLTRAVASLLAVTKSLCVCWLNGPVLSLRDDFVSIATELLGLGQPPFMLWVGVGWKPEGRLVYTKGMAQFGAHEIFLSKQAHPSEEILTYLHDLIRSVLASEMVLAVGETIEGPNCFFKITNLEGSDPNKKGLFLVPTQPN